MCFRLFFGIFVLFTVLMMYSCAAHDRMPSGDSDASGSGGSDMPGSGDGYEPDDSFDWERPGERFDDMIYTHPNVDGLIAEIARVEHIIEYNEGSPVSQLMEIDACLRLYSDFKSMKSHAEISFYKDRSDAVSSSRFQELHMREPEVRFAMEKLILAIKGARHSAYFSDALSGEGILRELNTATPLTEDALLLLKEEARLETELLLLSEETVTISYGGLSGTLSELKTKLRQRYGDNTEEYNKALEECRVKCSEKKEESCNVLTLEIIKLRSRFSQKMGYGSYSEYIFAENYDFSSADALGFIDSVSSYALPVYGELYSVFDRYFKTHSAPQLPPSQTVSILGNLYSSVNDELSGAFSRLIRCELYTLVNSDEPLGASGLSPYLYSINSPFIFINYTGNISDLGSFSGGFGEFASGYLSSGDSRLSSVSSSGMRLLTLAGLSDTLSAEDHKYLLYDQLNRVFSELLLEAYYTKLEYEIYKLPLSQIDIENINRIAAEIAEEFGISTPPRGQRVTEAIVVAPLESPMRAVSLAVGLDLFFTELEESGKGVDSYLQLLYSDKDAELAVRLESSGLSSPLGKDYLKTLSDKIHYLINGFCFFEDSNTDNIA